MKRELDALPGRIEELESQQAALHAMLSDPAFYRKDGDTIAATRAELARIEQELEQAYERWAALDEIAE